MSAISCVSMGAGSEGLATVATEPCVLCSSMALPTVSSRDVCVAMEPTGAAGVATAANCTCKICVTVYYKGQQLNNLPTVTYIRCENPHVTCSTSVHLQIFSSSVSPVSYIP